MRIKIPKKPLLILMCLSCFFCLSGFSNGKYDEELKRTEYTISDYYNFKSYMPYTAITSKSSPQYIMQQFCETNLRGLRYINDRYCIAVGTAFDAAIGQYIDIELENGHVINCVVGDIKADAHTRSDRIFTKFNNCCSEFIVDKTVLLDYVKKRGNISFLYPWWDSNIVKFYVYDEAVDIDYLREHMQHG